MGYTWDAGSRLARLADSENGTIQDSFDGPDRLACEMPPQGSVDYTYDAAPGSYRQTTARPPGQGAWAYSLAGGMAAIVT